MRKRVPALLSSWGGDVQARGGVGIGKGGFVLIDTGGTGTVSVFGSNLTHISAVRTLCEYPTAAQVRMLCDYASTTPFGCSASLTYLAVQ